VIIERIPRHLQKVKTISDCYRPYSDNHYPALPSKPLNGIALYDADAASALSFVKQKLRDAHVDLDFNPTQIEYVERLGGRASDLESVSSKTRFLFLPTAISPQSFVHLQLIHKLRSGQQVEEAVEDIINRGVGELIKNAFGDDNDDVKNLPWSREQAWAVLRLLSKREEVR
jgi:hypothetical protein